jgi:glutamate-ammonia-ligase adenylyltransferase
VSISDSVLGAQRFSRFAVRLLEARPDFRDELEFAEFRGWDRASMERFLASSGPEPESLNRSLRELRQRVVLRLALRDLAGIAPLGEVHAAMTALAEVTIAAAHRFWTAALEADFGVPHSAGTRQELLVVGMGKLGGAELNVSSDVDLIFLYPEEGETDGARVRSNHEFFALLGQRIISTLDEPTVGGRVFRVDMRLRPWGEGGPLATSLGALEQYFIVHGREWERYAWIKARVIAGGERANGKERGEQGERRARHAATRDPRAELAAQVRSFVYRRYLDYNAVGALRELYGQVRAEVARRDFADHVKLGAGGIREIEFVTQVHQLVRGGRDPQLQLEATMPTLEVLAARGLLQRSAVGELLAAYTFLRRLEHRLQYLDDAQTHVLPAAREDLELIAASMGFASPDAFGAALQAHRARVSEHFAAVFTSPQDAGSERAGPVFRQLDAVWQGGLEDEEAHAVLVRLGYQQPAEAVRRLRALRASARYRGAPASSQSRIDHLVPSVIEACGKQADPDIALGRMLHFVETIAGRSVYLGFLIERVYALGRLATLMAGSGWAAEYLSQHPILLDEILLITKALPPDPEAFAVELRQGLAEFSRDAERAMDVMRELHHARVFRLLALDLENAIELEQLSDHLSALADGVLAVTMEECWRRLPDRHRLEPRFAVIAYGKLGGKELGYASDLDLAFLYDDEDPRAHEAYARLAQRMVTWVSSRTAAGLLFDTDLRLRPNGEAGLMVISLEGFRKYQRESAWTWEHQALTRARFCAGDAAIGAAFERERRAILMLPRERGRLAEEIRAMREKMFDGHPNRSGLFDVKHGRGGMIDIEFVVQYLVLCYAGRLPQLTGNLGNIALLKMGADLGLIDHKLADPAAHAYREFRRVQHRLRLNGAEYARVPFASAEQWALDGRALWDAVLGGRRARFAAAP